MNINRPTLWQCSLFLVLLVLGLNAALKWWWTLHGIVIIPRQEYDIVIVGGGTSGSVLARRLWEGGNHSVLVIEPGNTAPLISSVPIMAPALQGYSADWAYKTVPQKFSHLGMKDRVSAWPRGKVLGGSSVLNFMVHMWGSKADFDDNWSSLGPQWNFASVKEYYKKMESYHGSYVSDVRGQDGLLHVEELNNSSPLASAFVKGALDLGIEEGDLNGELEHGVMLSQSNILRGSRVSAFDAYLYPVLKTARIHMLINSMVIKVIFKDKVAVAVDVLDLHSKTISRVRANKEIILSAGVIGSPQILMLSGIGPKEHLKKFKIPMVVDLPGVGRNLHDHLNVPMYFHINESMSVTAKKIKSLGGIYKYISKGEGYLGHSGIEAIARLPTSPECPEVSKMYFMLFSLGTVDESIFTSIANFKQETFRETFPGANNESKEGFILMVSCTHPHSRGYVQLDSSDPEDYPLINPRYLSDHQDVHCLIGAMKFAAELGTTKPLLNIGSRLHLPAYNSCSALSRNINNEKYLECWLKHSAITGYHPLGTCSIGQDDNKMAVLDDEFKVRGVKNLRIVDGSSIPFPIGGNPQATILMLAERASELILKSLKKIK